MILREPCLPPGWYPRQKSMIKEFIDSHTMGRLQETRVSSAVAPHAGWYYSGSLAALAVSCLEAEADTVAVIGGHLPKGMPVLVAGEDGVKTPMGVMELDKELRKEFQAQVSSRPDKYDDNTVEVLLPMVHYFFPQAKLLWLRFPADIASFDAGKTLAGAAEALGRRLAVLASTDLTHYGANYAFNPKGSGKPALEWMRSVNDAAFISAVLENNAPLVLRRAQEDRSACSPGAVLGALGFAASHGKTRPQLLEYRTSADAVESIPDSFVGYAAFALG